MASQGAEKVAQDGDDESDVTMDDSEVDDIEAPCEVKTEENIRDMIRMHLDFLSSRMENVRNAGLRMLQFLHNDYEEMSLTRKATIAHGVIRRWEQVAGTPVVKGGSQDWCDVCIDHCNTIIEQQGLQGPQREIYDDMIADCQNIMKNYNGSLEEINKFNEEKFSILPPQPPIERTPEPATASTSFKGIDKGKYPATDLSNDGTSSVIKPSIVVDHCHYFNVKDKDFKLIYLAVLWLYSRSSFYVPFKAMVVEFMENHGVNNVELKSAVDCIGNSIQISLDMADIERDSDADIESDSESEDESFGQEENELEEPEETEDGESVGQSSASDTVEQPKMGVCISSDDDGQQYNIIPATRTRQPPANRPIDPIPDIYAIGIPHHKRKRTHY